MYLHISPTKIQVRVRIEVLNASSIPRVYLEVLHISANNHHCPGITFSHARQDDDEEIFYPDNRPSQPTRHHFQYVWRATPRLDAATALTTGSEQSVEVTREGQRATESIMTICWGATSIGKA